MTPAKIATAEFLRRRAWLAGELAARRVTQAEADSRLLPWLHLAAMAGAELPAVYEDGITIFPFDRAGAAVRIPMSLTISGADREAALAELAKARDSAVLVGATTPERTDRARALMRLADHLGAPALAIPAQEGAPA